MIRRPALVLLALLAPLALAGCGDGNGDRSDYSVAAGGGGVQELRNVLDLRRAFEDDAGKTRLVVLFSPT